MTSLSKQITDKISRLPEDVSFGYSQLNLSKEEYQSAAKILERQQKRGVIKKLSKGLFYKPKKTLFGEKLPDEQQLIKPYLYLNNKRIAYVTGNYLYNRLGLTTQVPAIIQIASRDKRIFINRGTIKATAVKSYVDVTEDNYKLLGLLDALKDLRQIPDVSIGRAITVLKNQIEKLNDEQLTELVQCALKYPPRVRALLGALLTAMSRKFDKKILKDSLNPLTVFKLDIDADQLPSALEWNIQ